MAYPLYDRFDDVNDAASAECVARYVGTGSTSCALVVSGTQGR